MVIPEDLKTLFINNEIFLPQLEYENLLKGKETNFVFIKQGDRKQAVKLKLNPNYLKVKDSSIDNLLVILKPTQQLFIPKNIQAKLDEFPHLNYELLNNKFTIAQFALGSEKIQDFYLRIHPYLNRVEAYPVNQVAVPAQLNKYQIDTDSYNDLQKGKKINFNYQNNEYSVQFDPMNKRFKVHLANTFDEKGIPFAVNNDFVDANSIFQFIPFNNPSKVFSVEVTQDAINNFEKLNQQKLKVSDLTEYIEKNDFLKSIYPEITSHKINLFQDNALFKVEKATNQFENHYDVPISKRLFLAGTTKGNYLQNEAIFYAYKTHNAFEQEKKLEFSLTKNKENEISNPNDKYVKR
jgi:hypothetical protein